MLLVTGEAGVGKTTLVRAFCRGLGDRARVLVGSCDALSTPRPLGPLDDIARVVGGPLQDLVQLGAQPADVFAALRDELAGATTVVVLEDVHWADEATLDVLRLLARRIEALPALVLVTYRNDGLQSAHPTRILAGELATAPAVGRIELQPLSAAAVSTLATGHEVDLAQLYARTGGNPFFVTQALEAGDDEVPASVRDAVLARTARLGGAASSVIELVAVSPPKIDLLVLGSVVGGALDELGECVASGVVTAQEDGVAFRHELARMAVEESLAPTRRRDLHRAILDALVSQPGDVPDLARVAHHAVAAKDADAVLEYAPRAAERAASVGAYREAAAHYASAIRFAGGAPRVRRAWLLERCSQACYLADDQVEAIALLREAVELYRGEQARGRRADALSTLSSYLICRGLFTEADEATQEAISLASEGPTSPELARAYAARARFELNGNELDPAAWWSRKAVDAAESCGDQETLVQSLITLGTTALWRGETDSGQAMLDRAITIAESHGWTAEVARALSNLASAGVRDRSHALANAYLPQALDYCTAHNLDLWRINVLALRARSELDQGRWTEAADTAARLLEDPRESPWPQFEALLVLALVRGRRGDPDARALLEQTAAVDASPEEFECVAALAAARAEIAWLERKPDEIDRITADALALAVGRRESWYVGMLADWRRRAGMEEPLPAGAAEPYVLQSRGEWARAADVWTTLGCPYEAALARAELDDQDALRRALAELQQLGALPAARVVTQRLRQLGVRGLSRGPRDSTRQSPAGLTARETEVLHLLVQGLRNAQIADRLVVSARTVDHHVSAILRKLDAGSRVEAGARAAELGLVSGSRGADPAPLPE